MYSTKVKLAGNTEEQEMIKNIPKQKNCLLKISSVGYQKRHECPQESLMLSDSDSSNERDKNQLKQVRDMFGEVVRKDRLAVGKAFPILFFS